MKHFEDYCREYFQYLIDDFAFEPLQFLTAGERFGWTTTMQTKNNTTAVIFEYNSSDYMIDLYLSRLDAKGGIPKSAQTFYYDPNNPKDLRRKLYEGVTAFYFNVIDIIGLKSPEVLPGLYELCQKTYKDRDTYLETCVKTYAEMVKKYCGHILKGDFSEYDKVLKIQKARNEKERKEFEEDIKD